jgi:hypothetical protein
MGLMPADTILYFAIVNLDQGKFGAVKAKSRRELTALLKKQGFEPINVEMCGEAYNDGNINCTNPQKFDEQVIRRMLGLKKHSEPVRVRQIVSGIFGNGSAVKRLRSKESLYASLIVRKHSDHENMR